MSALISLTYYKLTAGFVIGLLPQSDSIIADNPTREVMVGPVGLEPTPNRLKVYCATIDTMDPFNCAEVGSDSALSPLPSVLCNTNMLLHYTIENTRYIRGSLKSA